MATRIENSATGNITEAYVSTGTLLLSDNLMWGRVFSRFNDKDFLTFMESNMNWAVSDGSTIRWHEQGSIVGNAKVGSISGGAVAGNSITITLSAASHTTSGTRSPFNKNKTVKIGRYDLFIQSKSTAVANAHTITCLPPVGSSAAAIALNTVIAAGQTIVPVGTSFAPGTDYVDGETSLPTEFEESLGIHKTSNTVTGSEATNKNKVQNPYTGDYYTTFEADYVCFLRHKLELSQQFLIGSGGTSVDDSGNTVQLIKGIEQQIRARGNTYNYNQTLTLQDPYNWTRILLTERAGFEHLLQCGHEVNIGLEQLMTESLKQGAKIYMDNSKQEGADKKLIDFGYDAFKMTDFMFYKKPFVEFNHPLLTYAPGQPYPNMIMITPHTLVKDPVSKKNSYTLMAGYKSAQGPKGLMFDRKFQFTQLGNSAKNPTSGVDNVSFNYLTEACTAIALANQAIIVDRIDI